MSGIWGEQERGVRGFSLVPATGSFLCHMCAHQRKQGPETAKEGQWRGHLEAGVGAVARVCHLQKSGLGDDHRAPGASCLACPLRVIRSFALPASKA